MRYKGNTAFQTNTGGFFSLFMAFFVIWYTINQFIQLIHRSDPDVIKNNIFHDGDEFGIRTAKDIFFDIGFGVYTKGRGSDSHDLEGYGSFNIFQFIYEDNSLKTERLTMKPCLETGGRMAVYKKDENIDSDGM